MRLHQSSLRGILGFCQGRLVFLVEVGYLRECPRCLYLGVGGKGRYDDPVGDIYGGVDGGGGGRAWLYCN